MQADKHSRRRRRDRWVQFRATAQEVEAITAQARGVGMSVGAYLRTVGAGYQPRAVVDQDRVDTMLKSMATSAGWAVCSSSGSVTTRS